jgi:putative redox protein
MATKTASIVHEGEGLRFAATSGSGHTIVLDDASGDAGMRPSELIPMALAACTAMDVISILRKKHQPVTRYAVDAVGEQRPGTPTRFIRIAVTHVVEGDVEEAAVRRAIELSATKYCSVGATLATGITEIRHGYQIRRPDGTELSGEVIAEGPYDHQAELLALRDLDPAPAAATEPALVAP